jgi:hypothetical protein
MRSLMILFAVGLASVTTTGSALAQNTLVIGRGVAPRVTTVPPTPYNGYLAPGQSMPQAYQMPNGRSVIITPTPLTEPAPVPGYPIPGYHPGYPVPGYPVPGTAGR